jgi:hypothetical protein
MATLAMQPITPAGVGLAYATASVGGDLFTPGADVLLHLKNTGGSSLTVTVQAQAKVLDEATDDVIVTIPAGAQRLAGPFPAPFFADPADGLAVIAYSDAANTQVAATGLGRGGFERGTIVSESGNMPVDLPSGSLWATLDGGLYLTPSSSAPASGTPVTSGSTVPSDLPPGSVYAQIVTGAIVDIYVTGGISAADIRVAAVAPTDLGPNQIAVVLGPGGTPSDLYVGGIS